ncbi:sialidase family protein [Streptomyces sp. rh34]|uniref:sialidase family protein n=1 Tax=Streptomyces sp. rh34 TaxID=2034272 RepID=UPI000BF067F3|nr:sialidase family protein [Streptomyces sp. rh34]
MSIREHQPGRRTVLTAGVLTGLTAWPALSAAGAVAAPVTPDTAPEPSDAAGAAQRHRWRTAVIGGTGFVTGVLFHPRVKGLAYARTDIGGAYRWDSRTRAWVPLTDHLGWDDWNLLGVEAMAVDPHHPDRLYLAVGTYAQSWSEDGAVLRSEDRGATWARTDLPVKLGANEDGRGTGERLVVDPADSDTLWLGTRHDGLWKSADRGATWARAGFGPEPVADGQGITLLVAAGRTLYAGWADGGSALYRRRSGATWEPVPGQPEGVAARVPVRAAYDTAIRTLHVTYADAPGPNGQSDGSVHALNTVTGAWSDITPVRPGGTTSDGSPDTFGYGGVAVDSQRPGTLVVTTNNRWADIDTVFRSTNGGRTWESLKDRAVLDVSETPYLRWGEPRPKFGWWIQAVAIDPFDSRHIVYGTGATLYGTRDLVHWAPEIRGLEESAVRQLISPPEGGAHLISGLADIGVMYHDSLTASPPRGMATNPLFGTSTGLAMADRRPSYVVRTGWSSSGNGAWSGDGGQSWKPFASQPDIASTAPGPIATSADGDTLLWSFVHWDGSTYATHRSTDNGATWAEVPTFPRGGTPVADPWDPRRFYAYDTVNGTVVRSVDGGRTFTAAATGLPAGDSQFRLAVTPGRSGHLWLSAKWNGLYRSVDGGATFTKVDSCWASYTLGFGKAAAGADHPTIFQVGATDQITAVLRSDDEGASWTRVNDDAHQWGWIGETITGDPRIHGRVYLGTNGRGVQYADPV